MAELGLSGQQDVVTIVSTMVAVGRKFHAVCFATALTERN
jgi:hypothetical protein